MSSNLILKCITIDHKKQMDSYIQINIQNSKVTVKTTKIDICLRFSKYSLRVTQLKILDTFIHSIYFLIMMISTLKQN